MSHALLIARREIVDRRNVYIGAAVLSVAPFIYQLIPNVRRVLTSEATAMTAVLLAYVFAFAIAIITGSTMIGRDLSERRLGFYLSRPISASALWFGKLIGTATVVSLGFLIVLLPSLAMNGFQWPRTWSIDQSVVLPLALLFFSILVAHAASTVLRSRSAWVVLDAAALVAVAAIWWWGVSRILPVSFRSTLLSIGVTAVTLFITLGLAGLVQLRVGRTDLKRSHRALSLFTWTLLGTLALGVAGYSVWFLRPAVEDLRYIEHAVEVPNGDWLVVQGPLRGRGKDYSPVFLHHIRDGRSIQVGGVAGLQRPVVSGDGRTVVIPSPHASYLQRAEERLVVVSLGSGKPATREIAIARASRPRRPERFPDGRVLPVPGHQPSLSPDGRQLFVPGDTQFQVFSLPDGNSVMSGRAIFPQPVFVSPEIIRIYTLHDRAIIDVDLTRRSMAVVGRLPRAAVSVIPSADGSRLIAVRKLGAGLEDHELTLHDGKSGALIRSIATNVSGEAHFLPDGRFLLFNHLRMAGGQSRGRYSSSLDLYDREGELITQWVYEGELAHPRAVSGDGTKLLVSVRENMFPFTGADTVVIDLVSLREVKRIAGLVPAAGSRSAGLQRAGNLAYDQSRSLWRVDWMTGAKTLVLRGGIAGMGVVD
jgi:hypothetical protein